MAWCQTGEHNCTSYEGLGVSYHQKLTKGQCGGVYVLNRDTMTDKNAQITLASS